jgi:hypothetical protein
VRRADDWATWGQFEIADSGFQRGTSPQASGAPGQALRATWGQFEPPVIPAKAGIHPDDSPFPKVGGVDSRFRGNDLDLANDTNTIFCLPFAFHSPTMSTIAAPVTNGAGGNYF